MKDEDKQHVSVPSFGDSFFIIMYRSYVEYISWGEFPSPHSGILFLYLDSCIANVYDGTVGFRPLIRGFFFYIMSFSTEWVIRYLVVSVPSFGDSFFMYSYTCIITCHIYGFPSPHSGILFLWADSEWLTEKVDQWFPSPHSGILFLYAAALMFNSNGGKFPSPHSGILFLSE